MLLNYPFGFVQGCTYVAGAGAQAREDATPQIAQLGGRLAI